MKPKNSDSNNAAGAVHADFSYFADKTAAAEHRINELTQQLQQMSQGQIPDAVLAANPDLAKLKQENDKLKYRCQILEKSISEEQSRCGAAGAAGSKNQPKKQSASISNNKPGAKEQSNPKRKPDAAETKNETSANKRAATYQLDVEPNSASLMHQLQRLFENAVRAATGEFAQPVALTEATRPQFGDYQCNSAMAIAQAMSKSGTKTNPRTVAEKILEKLPKNDLITKTEVAGPGFINIHLNHSYVTRIVCDVLLEGVKPPKLAKKRVVVDFSSPNIAKQMHVGHLRSTIIGDSICRLLEFVGFDVLRLNHIGDWGTQFGMLIAHLQDIYPDYVTKTPPIGDLQAFYKESKKRFDEDESFKARAYQCVVALQNYEENIVKAWRLICDVSRQDFERIYQRLDIKITDRGESFYQSRMGPIVQELKQIGLVKEEEGRQLVFPPGMDVPMTVVKSDGGYTYDTSDLAALKNRIEEEKADWIVYVIDRGQGMHMQQVFAVGQLIGWYNASAQRVEHVGFGLVLGEDRKKFKTRSGDTVRLTDLLDEGVKRAKEKLVEKQRDQVLSETELNETAEAVAYGCIKYADLSQNHVQDYVFSFDRMLDDRGNTAVYLLYSYVRIRSICRTANVSRSQVLSYVQQHRADLPLDRTSEFKVAKMIARFVDVVHTVLESFNLHLLCEYLYELSTVFTQFYDDCYCIEKDEKGNPIVNMHRVALCEATADVMLAAFNILGIRPLSRM